MESPTLRREHWRKSNQWFALTARHAQLVLEDTAVAEAFSKCALAAVPHVPPMASLMHGSMVQQTACCWAQYSCLLQLLCCGHCVLLCRSVAVVA
jgi:hypothetical protein